MYADDLLIMTDSVKKMEKVLKICETFGIKTEIKFNPTKTQIMRINGTKQDETSLELCGEEIEWVRKLKYLGVWVDGKHDSKEHLRERRLSTWRAYYLLKINLDICSKHFRPQLKAHLFKTYFDSIEFISDRECHDFTGLEKQEFFKLSDPIVSLRVSPDRVQSQVLAVSFFWLKTGFSQKIKAIIFGIKSQKNVSRYYFQARAALQKDYVLLYLGFKHLTRHEWLSHNTNSVTELFLTKPEQLCIIADTYCVQKKTHLMKPFVYEAAKREIMNVTGLYGATINDAEILRLKLKKSDDLNDLIEEGDIFILDKGYRDAVDYLKNERHLQIKIAFMYSSKSKTVNN
ncbi:Pro-Pol poly [Brachionus plicatilis]|uniref:Pro-Pol poly n=1 Tax=Brachionus plicatilis TaxID=10195 RepID=A0A3M7PV03_BRAPC|nr:Pro-Pol poly [Brachionus plicatilis]